MTPLLRYIFFTINSHQVSPTNNRVYAFFSPTQCTLTSCTFVCNLIQDPTSLVNAQLSNLHPTYTQRVRRSNDATPAYGFVHVVANLDVVHIHGCRLHSGAPTARIGSPIKFGNLHLCRWCTSTTPCAHRDQPCIQNR